MSDFIPNIEKRHNDFGKQPALEMLVPANDAGMI
jgi:hypothetical protein